jgi:hypothetical protein
MQTQKIVHPEPDTHNRLGALIASLEELTKSYSELPVEISKMFSGALQLEEEVMCNSAIVKNIGIGIFQKIINLKLTKEGFKNCGSTHTTTHLRFEINDMNKVEINQQNYFYPGTFSMYTINGNTYHFLKDIPEHILEQIMFVSKVIHQLSFIVELNKRHSLFLQEKDKLNKEISECFDKSKCLQYFGLKED